MDKEHVKGAADKTSGAMKDAAGKVTGNDKLRAEGQVDKAKGAWDPLESTCRHASLSIL